jgi:hypothetical protein
MTVAGPDVVRAAVDALQDEIRADPAPAHLRDQAMDSKTVA